MNLALFQAGYAITVIPPLLRSDYIAFIKMSQTGKKDDTELEKPRRTRSRLVIKQQQQTDPHRSQVVKASDII